MLEIPIWIFVLYSFALMLVTYLVYKCVIRKNRWLPNGGMRQFLWAGGTETEAEEMEAEELLEAAWMGSKTEVLKLLIEKGADINSADKDGNTPLRWAELESRTEVLRLLTERTTGIKPADGCCNYVPV